jgi:hypothetical protein
MNDVLRIKAASDFKQDSLSGNKEQNPFLSVNNKDINM